MEREYSGQLIEREIKDCEVAKVDNSLTNVSM